jgi:chemotaxis response regulator CheB
MSRRNRDLIVVGVSAGGTRALPRILMQDPGEAPYPSMPEAPSRLLGKTGEEIG